MRLPKGQEVLGWRTNSWLFRYDYSTAKVFVVDSEFAAQAVASRHLCGKEKQDLFRGAVADAWRHCGVFAMGRDWPAHRITECVILRGADHARPENPGELVGRRMTRTAIRMHRAEVSPGNWAATIVEGESENTNLFFQSRDVVIWDGCSASGSTLKSILGLLKTKNPLFRRALIVCPFMGDIALERVADQTRELGVRLSVLCFGVYRVAPIGWQGKTETDIYIPPNEIVDPSRTLAVPQRQREACHKLYQPREVSLGGVSINNDGFCLVGDVGESMAAAHENDAVTIAQLKEQYRYVRNTIQSWPEFCQSSVPGKLFATEAKLRRKIATLGGDEEVETQFIASS